MIEKEGVIRELVANREKSAFDRSPVTRAGRITRADRQIGLAAAEVGQAAIAFESRWTQLALRRTDPGLADRLNRQIKIWYDVIPLGDEERIVAASRAMLRGYQACSRAMEEAGQPDDAYQVVMSTRGRVYTFGPKACAEYLAQKFPGSCHYTFEDAVEALDGHSSLVGTALSVFPGAQIVETRIRGE